METIFIIRDLKQGRWIRNENAELSGRVRPLLQTDVIELAKTFEDYQTAEKFLDKLPNSYYQIDKIFVVHAN